MPSARKLALGTGAIIAFCVALLIVLPFLFRHRIVSRLKAEIERSVDARVNWTRVGLSVLRDFPNVTIRDDRPSVVGVNPFAGDTLVTMRTARLVHDVGSVVQYLRNGANIV